MDSSITAAVIGALATILAAAISGWVAYYLSQPTSSSMSQPVHSVMPVDTSVQRSRKSIKRASFDSPPYTNIFELINKYLYEASSQARRLWWMNNLIWTILGAAVSVWIPFFYLPLLGYPDLRRTLTMFSDPYTIYFILITFTLVSILISWWAFKAKQRIQGARTKTYESLRTGIGDLNLTYDELLRLHHFIDTYSAYDNETKKLVNQIVSDCVRTISH